MSDKSYDVVVIGGGPAGLAAALEARAARPDGSVLIIERDDEPGGILRQCIHNGFGLHYFGEELTGPEYAARFVERLSGAGVELMLGTMALSVSRDGVVTSVNPVDGLVRVRAGAIVLTMGCRERTRGALGIPGSRPAGVYTAGCAQRLVNMEGYMPGRRVIVLGSGDIGLIMARRMTWEGAKVELVAELMPYSSGLNRNIVQCLQDNDIPLKFNHTVVNIGGRERVESVTVAEVDPNTRRPIPGTEEVYPCDTLLLSVGLIPENELTREAGIDMDPVTGGAVVDECRQTSIPGIFAAGNVLHVHDLVDNVSVEAAIAGRAAALFAAGELDSGGVRYAASPGEGVRYVIPQYINARTEGKLDLYFRSGGVYKPAAIRVRSGDDIIKRSRRQIVTPGEMEKITIDAGKLSGDITIEVEEVV